MGLDSIVNVTISVESTAPSRAGFGTPLIAAYHTNYADRVREYSEPAALIDDGFTVNDPVYKAAAAMWSQSPHPQKFKVGRRALAFTQLIDLFPVNTDDGFVYELTIRSPDGTTTTVTKTNGPAETVATICAALQTGLDAITDLSATNGTTHVSCTADNAGELFDFDIGTADPKDDLILFDITADPGLAADLAEIKISDPTGWYALALDSNSAAEVAAAAGWLETEKKIGAFNSSDGEIIDAAVTDDLFSTLQSLNYTRTAVLFSKKKLLNYSGAAWLGKMLPTDPGTATWAFKTLAGVVTDVLKSGHQTAILNKGGNHYTSVAGVSITFEGKSPMGEYVDTTRFVDFLHARIQEDVYTTLINNSKIPYTDTGVQIITGAVKGRLLQNVSTEKFPRGLSDTPAPTVTAPLVADVAQADRINRTLPDVNFSAQLAGAIHTITIKGKITV